MYHIKKKLNPKSYQYPTTPPLTKLRLCDNCSFYITRTHNFGPLSVKSILGLGSSTMHTVSMTLYICASSQALLLDLVRSKVRQISLKVSRDLLVERVFHMTSSPMGVAILFINGLGVSWIINMTLSLWYGGFFECLVKNTKELLQKYRVHWGINPNSETLPPSFSPSPLKSTNCPSPLFQAIPPYI